MLGAQESLQPQPYKSEAPRKPNRPKRMQSLLGSFPPFLSLPTHSPEPKAGQMGLWREEAEGGGRLRGGSDLTPAGATS